MTAPSPPGWYPDPHSPGRVRYWNGHQWDGAPTKPPTNWKMWGIIAAILVVLVIVANVVDDAKDKAHPSASSKPRTTTSAAAAAPALPAAPRLPVDGVTFGVLAGVDGDIVTAEFPIHDNFTEGLVKTGARMDTIKILQYADQKYPQAAEVRVLGRFPMTDAYGNTSTMVVVSVSYLRATLDKINFDGIDPHKIWEIRDSGIIHPAFRP